MQNSLNIDCMDFMKSMPDKFYDIAIVDPPYGINQGGDKNKTRRNKAKPKDYHAFDDYKSPEKSYFIELERVSKNQIIWGANHFISKISKDSSCWLIWYKNNGKSDFADAELAYTSFKSGVRIYKYTWNGMIQENMKNKEIRIHPTQKPIALYKWILKNYAKKGFKILDTHSGSASLAIACYEMNFYLDACEIDKFFFELSVKRYNNYIAQLRLF